MNTSTANFFWKKINMKRVLQSLDSLAPFMFLDLLQCSFHFTLLLIPTHSSVFSTFMRQDFKSERAATATKLLLFRDEQKPLL